MKTTIDRRWEYLFTQMRRDTRSGLSWLSTALFFGAYFVPWPYAGIILALSLVLFGLDIRVQFRRRRPRQRMRDAGMMLGPLTIVFVIMPVIFRLHKGADPTDIEAMTYAFLLFAGVTGTLAAFCLWRWRRLRADAEVRLWQLHKERKKTAKNRLG